MKNICFTGHRDIPNGNDLYAKTKSTLEELIRQGATDFYAGGAMGFDTLAASIVVELQSIYPIKLHLILPCRKADQTAKWTAAEIGEYDRLLSAADDFEMISERYYNGCMRARNARLVELADGCVCYYDPSKYASGTGQTVRMAKSKGVAVINMAGNALS